MTKRTVLYEEHIKLKAKMVEFAGWEMPVQYTSIIEEHNNVRKNAGIFDISHMGEIFVSGKDSLKYLQTLVAQDLSKLINKRARYCQFTNNQGGIIDDLFIYKLSNDYYLLIVNAARLNIDYDWMIKNQKDFDINIENMSEIFSMIALQGPKSSDILDKIGYKKAIQPKTMYICDTEILGRNAYISRTGYTGEDGFEIIIKNENAKELWLKLLEAGKEYNILPVGLGARDTLRLEAAMSLYGNELNETTTPIEADLTWSIDKDKKEEYIGGTIIKQQLKEGVKRKLIAFRMTERAIPRHEYEIYYNNEIIGYVTSGGYAPFLNQNIGLGYINTSKNLKINDIIQIKVRNKFYNAQITNKNFIEKHNKGN